MPTPKIKLKYFWVAYFIYRSHSMFLCFGRAHLNPCGRRIRFSGLFFEIIVTSFFPKKRFRSNQVHFNYDHFFELGQSSKTVSRSVLAKKRFYRTSLIWSPIAFLTTFFTFSPISPICIDRFCSFKLWSLYDLGRSFLYGHPVEY